MDLLEQACRRGLRKVPEMAVTYFRRYTMVIDLGDWLSEPTLPKPYRWVPWEESLLDVHAEVKYRCFAGEMDTNLFPCLGNLTGCRQLMRAIRKMRGFLPAATWLIAHGDQMCATIQGALELGLWPNIAARGSAGPWC